MKKYILSLCLVIITLKSFSQFSQYATMEENDKKYWYYRNRLVHYFVQVGPNPGESIMAQTRNSANSDCAGFGATTNLHYDDSPNFQGFYLGVLGTEYALLDNSSEHYSETVRELYYALFALNRLDQTDGGIGNTVLDGFMIREDVPANFVQTHDANLNTNLPFTGIGGPWINTRAEDGWIRHVEGVAAFSTCPDPLGDTRKAVSKDHMIRLLMGLSLIIKGVDAQATYNNTPFQDGETHIKQEAINIVDRMITYIKNNHWFLMLPTNNTPPSALLGLWQTCATNETNLLIAGITSGTWPQMDMENDCMPALSATTGCVPRGYDPIWLSFGIAEAGNKMTAQNYQTPVSQSASTLWQLLGMQSVGVDIYSSSTGLLTWSFILAAIGDSWGHYNLLGNWVNKTQDWMVYIDDDHVQWRFYNLLHAYLHPGSSDQINVMNVIRPQVQLDLSLAPCEGSSEKSPYYFMDNKFLTFANYQTPNTGGAPIAFNGLDFMLLYNLYKLNYSTQNDHLAWGNIVNNGTYDGSNGKLYIDFNTATSNNVISGYDLNIDADNWALPHNYASGTTNTQTGNITNVVATLPWFDIGSGSHPVSIYGFHKSEIHGTLGSNADITFYSPETFSGQFTNLHTNGASFHFPSNTGNLNSLRFPRCNAGGGYERLAPVHHNSMTQDSFIFALNHLTPSLSLKPIANSSVVISPNPSHGSFTIEFISPKTEPAEATIYNTLGVKVQTISTFNQLTQGINRQQINTEHLSPGFYNIQLKTPTQVVNKQFIIQ